MGILHLREQNFHPAKCSTIFNRLNIWEQAPEANWANLKTLPRVHWHVQNEPGACSGSKPLVCIDLNWPVLVLTKSSRHQRSLHHVVASRLLGGEMVWRRDDRKPLYRSKLKGKVLTSVNIPHNDNSILEPQGHIRTAFTYDTEVNLFWIRPQNVWLVLKIWRNRGIKDF